MKKIRLLRNLLTGAGLLLGIGLMELQAQETILASGGDATGNGGTASYSIGQLFYSVHTLSEAYISEGVQQPYEIYVLSGKEDAAPITLKFRAYPNPVSDFLFLQLEDSGDLQAFFQLFDSKGRLLMEKRISGIENMIPMESYVAGIYYLNVRAAGKKAWKFKIIKN